MTKQDSKSAKGLAILFMLFLHLFNHEDIYIPLFFIDGITIERILSRACNPVPFYLILGGIGMYSVWKVGTCKLSNNLRRLFRLYIHYWIILILFVCIGHFIDASKYPGSLTKIIGNFTAFTSTYNGECWFLFPYMLLVLSSSFLFRILEKYKWRILVISFLIGIVTSYIISRYGEKYLFNNMFLYNPILYFHLMFPFLLGASVVKYNALVSFKKFEKKKLTWMLLGLTFMIPCIISLKVFYCFYALLIIILFTKAPKCKLIVRIFSFLGTNSMNMWLVHTWFAYYLFHDFVYGFKYSFLIYFILIVLSLVTSIIVNYLAKPITNKI